MSTQPLTPEEAESIMELLWDETNDEIELRDDYSGRGMYGERCIAFVGDRSANPAAIAYVCAKLDIPWNRVPKRQDSMGLGWVIY